MRWNNNGDMLASSSFDNSVKLIDLKAGKVIYKGTTPDSGKLFVQANYCELTH